MPTPPNRKKKQDKDAELIRAINAGKHDLFHELVTRYQQSLYNFGFRMCGNAQDTEDIVQETFLNVFKYLKDFRYETKFKNWMYRIATSTCIKKRRRSKYAPDKELSLDDFIPKDPADMPQDMPNWATLPLDKVLNDELSSHIKEAILSLPDKYRVVIILRDVEGFSTDEAAQILNLTPSNIKVRLHRARLYVRERLKDYFQDDK